MNAKVYTVYRINFKILNSIKLEYYTFFGIYDASGSFGFTMLNGKNNEIIFLFISHGLKNVPPMYETIIWV